MLSLIICTYNPRLDLLAWTLASVAAQADPGESWEVVIVDNRSTPPLDLEAILPSSLKNRSRLVRENEPGLSAARCAGIAASRGGVLVFADDDNYLAEDYLAQAWKLAQAQPELGCFGGKAEPQFEYPPAEWLRPLLNNLGLRDFGSEPIVSREQVWGPWEPIGAGMVVRRSVANAFAEFYRQQHGTRHLGRNSDSLASCEDSLIAHLSLKLGFANAYQPALHLRHFIKDFRVLPSYLARLMLAMGSSYRLLLDFKGTVGSALLPVESTARYLLDTLSYRLRILGDVGYIQWMWDLGYAIAETNFTWPKITVVVPVYNSAATLRRTLESLKAQAYPALEVIVQDGGSSDGSLAILSDYKALLTNVESRRDDGQADALNRGFTRSTGEIEAWLCSDDEYRPGILFYVALQFLLHPDVEFLAAGCLRVFPDGSQAQVRPVKEKLPTLGYHNFIDQPSTFWRRSLRLRAGPLDETLHYAFDWEYWNRFVRTGARMLLVPELLSVYYFSDTNKTSAAGSRQIPELVHVVRKYGPLDGRLARIYRLLYRRFDLLGCYDTPPSATPERLRRFQHVLQRLVQQHGPELIYAYNWSYASRQQRNLVWYK